MADSKEAFRSTAYPMIFAAALPLLKEVAREHGYALGVHGSMARDLDLIACPWTEAASFPHILVEAVRAAIGGTLWPGPAFPPDAARVTAKPHGRLAWSIYLREDCSGPYLDLSVMPRL